MRNMNPTFVVSMIFLASFLILVNDILKLKDSINSTQLTMEKSHNFNVQIQRLQERVETAISKGLEDSFVKVEAAILKGMEAHQNVPPRLEDFENLPPGLEEYGKALIGLPMMQILINEALPVTELSVSSKKILLKSHKDDDTLPRLRFEFEAHRDDPYGFEAPFKNSSADAPPLVLDVGGNIGLAAISFAKFHPEAQVVTFEPNPFTYIYLLWNIHLNGIHVLTSEELELSVPGITGIYPVLGGLKGGAGYFEKMPMPNVIPGRSQNFQVHLDKNGNTSEKYIPVYSLTHFLKMHKLLRRGIEVMKLDCECCEYLVLPSNKDILGNHTMMKRIVGELHPFEKCMKGFGLGLEVQDQVLNLLERRECALGDKDFKNGFIGIAEPNKGEKCCPNFRSICPY